MKKTLIYLSLLSSIFYCIFSHAKTIERIVAIINSDIITETDIKGYRSKLLTNKGLIEPTLLKFADVNKLKKNSSALLQHLINERLVDSQVQKSGIAITIEMIEAEIRKISGQRRISRAQLKQALKAQGVDFADYQDFIKKGLERHTLISKEVSSKIKISGDEIASFYIQKTKNSDSLVFEYKLAHILFLPGNGGDNNAKERAEAVLKKIKSNKDFVRLASQHSEDPNFSNGGLLGDFKKGEMLPAMEEAIKNLKVGETSSLVKTRAGYHILQVLKKTLVEDPKLQEQRENIHQLLFAKAFDRSIRSWLKQLRQGAYVHINKSK